jgi:hypothetical protein
MTCDLGIHTSDPRQCEALKKGATTRTFINIARSVGLYYYDAVFSEEIYVHE